MIVLYESACPSYPDYLMHHGVKGQKWGVRRFQRTTGANRVRVEAKDRGRMARVDKSVKRFHRGSSLRNYGGYLGTVGVAAIGGANALISARTGHKVRAVGHLAATAFGVKVVGDIFRGGNDRSASKMASQISKSTGIDKETAHSMADGYRRSASMLTGKHIGNQVLNSLVTQKAARVSIARGHKVVGGLITGAGVANSVRMAVKAHGERKQLRTNMHNDVYNEMQRRRGYQE